MSTVSTKSETVTQFSDVDEEITGGAYANAIFKTLEVDCLTNDPAIEIDPSRLHKLAHFCLGKGHTGVVYLGCWLKGPNCAKEIVAIKMPKYGDASEEELETEKQTILDEIKILSFIGKHENVLQLKGAVTFGNNELWMALEYCELGSLKKFLPEKRRTFHDEIVEHACEDSGTVYKMQMQNNHDDLSYYWNNRKDGFISTIDLLNFALQIANGMSFLHRKGIVHRDLALRNVLLTVDYKIKIADFGLSRKTRNGYYTRTMPINQAIPYLWTAPEAIASPKVLLESDWWTFGVVLWELFEFGATPYGEVTGIDILSFLEQGKRLGRPCFCPAEIYTMMSTLWSFDPHQRMSLRECSKIISAQLTLAAGPVLLNKLSETHDPAQTATDEKTSAVRRTEMMKESRSKDEFDSKQNLLPSSKYVRIFLLATFSFLILIILAMGAVLLVLYNRYDMSSPGNDSCRSTLVNGTVREWNGHAYMYVSTETAWKEAEQACVGWGGHLASIHSDKENDFLLEMHKGEWAWIGLNDIDKENTFVWIDGTNKTLPDKFYPGEPNNGNGNEHCAVQRPTLNDWNDDQCYNKWPFVCKKVLAFA